MLVERNRSILYVLDITIYYTCLVFKLKSLYCKKNQNKQPIFQNYVKYFGYKPIWYLDIVASITSYVMRVMQKK